MLDSTVYNLYISLRWKEKYNKIKFSATFFMKKQTRGDVLNKSQWCAVLINYIQLKWNIDCMKFVMFIYVFLKNTLIIYILFH